MSLSRDPEDESDVLIECRNVCKSFGDKHILRGVSLKIRHGEAVGIIGPSGTGKSTILKIMAGLLAPDKGEVLIRVARCQFDPETEVVEGTGKAGDLGIVGDDVQDFGSDSFSPSPGIETVCVFPKNPSKVVAADEESELLVRMKNDGGSSLNIIAIQASLHLPFDHRYLVQNLSVQAFNNAIVPPSVSKFMQVEKMDKG